jgi:hypothetical protein
MIRDRLIPALKTEFSGWEIVFDEPPQPIATFPACQEAVGKVFVSDDGDEATVFIENITHGHFGSFDESLKPEEREKIIADNVVDFLKALFSDRVLLHTTAGNRIGGWTRLDLADGPAQLSPSAHYFLWSEPYKP